MSEFPDKISDKAPILKLMDDYLHKGKSNRPQIIERMVSILAALNADGQADALSLDKGNNAIGLETLGSKNLHLFATQFTSVDQQKIIDVLQPEIKERMLLHQVMVQRSHVPFTVLFCIPNKSHKHEDQIARLKVFASLIKGVAPNKVIEVWRRTENSLMHLKIKSSPLFLKVLSIAAYNNEDLDVYLDAISKNNFKEIMRAYFRGPIPAPQ